MVLELEKQDQKGEAATDGITPALSSRVFSCISGNTDDITPASSSRAALPRVFLHQWQKLAL